MALAPKTRSVAMRPGRSLDRTVVSPRSGRSGTSAEPRRAYPKTDGSGYGWRQAGNHGRRPAFSDGWRGGFLNSVLRRRVTRAAPWEAGAREGALVCWRVATRSKTMACALGSRSTVSGFAKRTLTNLLFVASTPEKKQVHIVTQIITSMLGLLIFVHEHLEKHSNTKGDFYNPPHDFPDWSKWQFDPQMSKSVVTNGNFCKLLKHLRNAVSHYRIEFSPSEHSDSRDPEQVTIHFRDCPPNKPVDWHVSVNGKDLLDFLVELAKRIESALPSP